MSGFWRMRLMSMDGLGVWAALVLMVLLKHFVCLKKGLMGQKMGGKKPGRGSRAFGMLGTHSRILPADFLQTISHII